MKVTRINQPFDQAVAAPPPSRLSANGVLRAAQVRRQRITAAIAGVALLVGGTAVALGLTLSGGRTEPAPAEPVAHGSLVWAGRGDVAHLYRLTNVCGEDRWVQPSRQLSAPPCNELWASTDAGASWTSRGLTRADLLFVVGPLTLLRPDSLFVSYERSADGGATWSPLPTDGAPLDAVPASGIVVSRTVSSVLYLDPSQTSARSLAGPAIAMTTVGQPAWSDHRRAQWLGGVDLTTGRLSVAVGRAGDHSWTLRPLPDLAPVADPAMMQTPEGVRTTAVIVQVNHPMQIISSADGRTAYAVVYEPRPTPQTLPATGRYRALLRGFSTTDGGASWREIAPQASVPAPRGAWLTADGRFVVVAEMNDPAVAEPTGRELAPREFAVGDASGQFSPAAPPGLPVAGLTIMDSSFGYTDHAMYVSDDGWTWHEAWHE